MTSHHRRDAVASSCFRPRQGFARISSSDKGSNYDLFDRVGVVGRLV